MDSPERAGRQRAGTAQPMKHSWGRKVSTAALLLVSFALAGCATKNGVAARLQSAFASRDPTLNWDCDVAAGSASRFDYTLNAAAVLISGSITLVEAREHAQWAPGATIRIGSPDKEESSGVQLVIQATAPDRITVVGFTDDGKIAVMGTLPRTADPVPVSLYRSREGAIVLRVADFERRDQAHRSRQARIGFACSTSEFQFSDFTVHRLPIAQPRPRWKG